MSKGMRILILGWLAAQAVPAAAFVLGGGDAAKDCRVGFGGLDPTVGQSGVVCQDGDPSCDADGTADGACRFDVALCTGVPETGCVPSPIDTIEVAGLPFGLPPLPSLGEGCGPPLTVTVPVETAMGATVLADSGSDLADVDYLNLCCRPPGDLLAAARCALGVNIVDIVGCAKGTRLQSIRAPFVQAGMLIERAAGDPAHATHLTARAVRALKKVRSRGRRLAKFQPCGDSVALIATHALTTLGASP
jgi:hypothetical protein